MKASLLIQASIAVLLLILVVGLVVRPTEVCHASGQVITCEWVLFEGDSE